MPPTPPSPGPSSPDPSAPDPRPEPAAEPGPPGEAIPSRGSRHTGMRWWRPWTPLAIGIALAFVGGVAASVVPLPYAVLQPGPVTNVLGTSKGPDGADVPRIVIDKATTYPTSGALDFTTVRVLGGPGYRVNAVDLLVAWLSPTQDVYPVDDVFPPQATQEQVAQENHAEMVSSQQEAAAVALRATGVTVPVVVKVAQVAADAPAAGQLQAGDVLVTVGGAPAGDPAAVRAAIQKVTSGDTVDVVVRRGGAETTAHPRTGTTTNTDGTTRTYLGIVLATDYDLPFPVTVDAGNVGGPSAGLMFSLGIYDKLTDGALTGGRTIAGTGTIDDSGAVGPIGGIRQKMAGAQEAGATFFLAPSDNCTDVVGGEPVGVQVVKVSTFADALAAVRAIGAGHPESLPHC